MKLRVEVSKDSAGRLDKLNIFKGRQRRSVDLRYIYGADGFVREIEFIGRRADLPNIPEIINLVNESFIERIGTINRIDKIINVGNLDTHSQLRGHGLFVDRMTWIGLPSVSDSLEVFKQTYRGRGGFKCSWWDSEAEQNSEDWSLPITEKHVNTNETSPPTLVPWTNAIHLRNSKDGEKVDMIYFAPEVEPFHRWMMRFDLKCPTLASLPMGADSIVLGFEVPFMGGHTIYMLHIEKTQVTLIARIAKKDGTHKTVQSSDISSWIANNTWNDLFLVLDPPYFRISDDAANTAEINISDADITFYPEVTPFFANECNRVVSDVYLGQLAAWHIVPRRLSSFPLIYNKTMTSVDTEYSQALPADTKKFLVHSRDGTAFRLAFETGKVATPTTPYFSVPANGEYYEDHINPSSLTLYLGCASAAKIIEIIAWS